ncbi:Pol polyprotein [Elysia marginata]|uniref:Pol polyprotein n=1 Tax=Elysia marginata TaxID=1093978 RepID=A0AAV4FVP4_9GAST|nr:Pol polyprotein [Elysia marginata]
MNLIVINSYAPCGDKEKMLFLNQLYKELNKETDSTDEVICLGDFKTVLNNSLDIFSGNPHNSETVSHFNAWEEEKIKCDKELSEQEISSAFKTMKNGSSPGPDGIPFEFYKVFWKDLKKLFKEARRYSQTIGKLSSTQRQGTISLIHKVKAKPRPDAGGDAGTENSTALIIGLVAVVILGACVVIIVFLARKNQDLKRILDKYTENADPKDLNKVIKRTHYKIPTPEETSHKFSGARYFSKLDAQHGYWAIHLDESSSKLTSFNSPFGRYRLLRLSFELNVSHDIFQKKMGQILERCPGTLGISDDVCVFGRTEEEHDKNLLNLMEVSRTKGLASTALNVQSSNPIHLLWSYMG